MMTYVVLRCCLKTLRGHILVLLNMHQVLRVARMVHLEVHAGTPQFQQIKSDMNATLNYVHTVKVTVHDGCCLNSITRFSWYAVDRRPWKPGKVIWCQMRKVSCQTPTAVSLEKMSCVKVVMKNLCYRMHGRERASFSLCQSLQAAPHSRVTFCFPRGCG
jgi:hypothetical protein